ncbi:MAG: YceD family protein [Blautia hansenii]
MLIDLSEILSLEGKTQVVEAPVSMDSFQSKLGDFPVAEKEPFADYYKYGKEGSENRGEGRITVNIPCDKCLKDVPTEFDINFEQEIDMQASKEDRIKDLDEINYVTGCSLDVEQLVHNEILIHWPLRVLCKEDCRGICPKCGKDWNEGSCDCDQSSPDPRMAVISDIFSKFKEV